ncbi:UL24 [Eptesicus fuscus gammaherpesvirus]|uniref:UL24 n=1 Tax=vespertilionid gammaherpesvirus 3 TaxID=2846598 RepID=A0A2D0ZNX0_9GAMA|nr:UL24 [Eptesicus fuscus gammaherpesvirus]ATA58249.1 UL24 [Eptesicus fuscus gammaherpesvirus]WAH70920.1 nuclear protein [Eptesicus fuscus gammaherpesvirus]
MFANAGQSSRLDRLLKKSRETLSKLPNTRKAAGNKAHLASYKKMCGYSRPASLLKFLGVSHPCPTRVTVNLFFEVTLGPRIADCVMLVASGETRACYVIEFKTCITQHADMRNEVRRSQRLQGLCQLADAVQYLSRAAPVSRQVVAVLPYLVFKCQKTLKTLHVETPAFAVNQIHTNWEKLHSFLFSRQDGAVRQLLRAPASQSPTAPTQQRRLLGARPAQRAAREQGRAAGGAKKRAPSAARAAPRHVGATAHPHDPR